MSKPTKATVRQRVEEVLRIRLDGAEFWDVREYAREKCAEKGSVWENPKCLSDGQLYRYIARADRLIAESCRSSRKRLTRRHLAQRRNLFSKSVNAGDLRTALAVLADEARLLGLYDPPPAPKPRGDVPATPAAVVAILAARLASIDQAKLPANEKARLTAIMGDALLRAIGAADFEKQLAELLSRVEMLTKENRR
jgi:hypothetical protein